MGRREERLWPKTVGEFLLEWLSTIRMTLRPSTWEGYEVNIRRHILPYLGGIPLPELGPQDLNALYRRLLVSGNVRGGGLAPRTVRYVHTIIRRALRDAVRWGEADRNVADLAEAPRRSAPEMRTWSADELRRFLESVSGHPLHAAWLLLATTGMRRGEVLGLRWRDIDLPAGRLSIRQTLVAVHHRLHFSEPKTRRGIRQIFLPGTVNDALEKHRRNSQHPCGPDDLVFLGADSGPVHPDGLTRTFQRLARRAGLPVIRLHDLRHTFATLALQAGIHSKVVSEILGHANITITLDTYSHVLPALSEEATAKVAELVLPPGIPDGA